MSRKHLTEDQLQRMIANDPEAPEATADQLTQARPFTKAFPALSDAMRRNMGGRPKAENRRLLSRCVWIRMWWPGSRKPGQAGRPG